MSASKSAPHSKDHSAGRFSATAQDWLEGARPHTWANAFAPVVAGTGAAFGIDGGHVGRAPVSYTHLTLPTICSV